MNTETPGTFDALVQGKLTSDTAFNDSIAALSDEEKTVAIDAKKAEIAGAEFARLSKSEELATNYKTRAEKAEKALKGEEEPKAPAPAADPSLSTNDLYALMQAQVPQEDVEEVSKAAKLLGVSIQDALKDETVRGILKTRTEHRASAAAANIGPVRPGATKATDEQVVAAAAEGKVPKPGSAEAEQLFWARRGGKK